MLHHTKQSVRALVALRVYFLFYNRIWPRPGVSV
jgi:hypothetical protein